MQAVLDGKTLITYRALNGKTINMSVAEAMSFVAPQATYAKLAA